MLSTDAGMLEIDRIRDSQTLGWFDSNPAISIADLEGLGDRERKPRGALRLSSGQPDPIEKGRGTAVQRGNLRSSDFHAGIVDSERIERGQQVLYGGDPCAIAAQIAVQKVASLATAGRGKRRRSRAREQGIGPCRNLYVATPSAGAERHEHDPGSRVSGAKGDLHLFTAMQTGPAQGDPSHDRRLFHSTSLGNFAGARVACAAGPGMNPRTQIRRCQESLFLAVMEPANDARTSSRISLADW